jgi:hypothetical protein
MRSAMMRFAALWTYLNGRREIHCYSQFMLHTRARVESEEWEAKEGMRSCFLHDTEWTVCRLERVEAVVKIFEQITPDHHLHVTRD